MVISHLAPNALAFPEAAIEHFVGAQVALGPVTLVTGGILAALNEEPANVIHPVAAHVAVGEGELEFHPMPIARAVIVEPCSWPGWKERLAHQPSFPLLPLKVSSAMPSPAPSVTMRSYCFLVAAAS